MLRTMAIVLAGEGRYGAEMRANHSLQGKLQFAAAGSFTADAEAGHGGCCKGLVGHETRWIIGGCKGMRAAHRGPLGHTCDTAAQSAVHLTSGKHTCP